MLRFNPSQRISVAKAVTGCWSSHVAVSLSMGNQPWMLWRIQYRWPKSWWSRHLWRPLPLFFGGFEKQKFAENRLSNDFLGLQAWSLNFLAWSTSQKDLHGFPIRKLLVGYIPYMYPHACSNRASSQLCMFGTYLPPFSWLVLHQLLNFVIIWSHHFANVLNFLAAVFFHSFSTFLAGNDLILQAYCTDLQRW